MAKVQEYLPEAEAQGPVGQTSPMLEEATQYGRGISDFGRMTMDAFQVVHQRQTQEETSNAYADVSEQRSQMMTKIQQQINDGTLDTGKIKEETQDWIDKNADSYSTAGGKDAFNRASARLYGGVMQHAAIGQTVVAGNKAKENLSTMINNDSNLLMKHPDQFGALRDEKYEYVQQQVKAGAFSPSVALQVQKGIDMKLSKSAVRGIMQADYNNIKQSVINNGDKVDPNIPALNGAKRMLDGGQFDSYLDSSEKKELYDEIKSNQVAAQIAGKQNISMKEAVTKAQGESWKVEANSKLMSNSLNPDEVTTMARKGIIDSKEQLTYLKLIDAAGKEDVKTNHTMKNEIVKNILSDDNTPGHISDPNQIAQHVGMGLTPRDYWDLSNQIKQHKTDIVGRNNEQQLMNAVDKQIHPYDPNGDTKKAAFFQEIQQRKDEAIKNGEPTAPLFDPNSPKYLGRSIPKYQTSPADALKANADMIRAKASAPAKKVDDTPDSLPALKAIKNFSFSDLLPSKETFANAFGANEVGGVKFADMGVEEVRKVDIEKLSSMQKDALRNRILELKGKR